MGGGSGCVPVMLFLEYHSLCRGRTFLQTEVIVSSSFLFSQGALFKVGFKCKVSIVHVEVRIQVSIRILWNGCIEWRELKKYINVCLCHEKIK